MVIRAFLTGCGSSVLGTAFRWLRHRVPGQFSPFSSARGHQLIALDGLTQRYQHAFQYIFLIMQGNCRAMQYEATVARCSENSEFALCHQPLQFWCLNTVKTPCSATVVEKDGRESLGGQFLGLPVKIRAIRQTFPEFNP